MVNLLDVVDTPKIIKSKKYGELNVHGLSIEGLAFLIKKHPGLFKLFDGSGSKNFDSQKIIDLGVDVFSDFLASGLGYPGNVEATEKCRGMNPEDAWDIGQAILEESFPGGAANFFERVSEAAMKAKMLVPGSQVEPAQTKEGVQKEASLNT